MVLLCNNFLLSSAASFQRNRILRPTTLKPHSTSTNPIAPLRIRSAQLLRVGCNGTASPVVHCADLVEKDWSFIDSDVDESGWDAKCRRIVSVAEVGEKSRLLVSFGASGFIDKIVTECQCETLLVVHDSLFDLAMIKEKYDRVRCWQGSIMDLPEKFLPLDVVFVCYFPGMGVSVEDLLASLARSCSPGLVFLFFFFLIFFQSESVFDLTMARSENTGARVVICCDQGREIVEQVHKQQHPDIVTSDLPCKTNLEMAAGANSFRLTEFVDDPTFYLAVLKFSQ